VSIFFFYSLYSVFCLNIQLQKIIIIRM
jgi:hypothetical protein